ncbi:uncharacterized protein V1510DRAFT_420909 [Dipodascopsis tothii]|uniref:uncharacterized protein n=1 Tax=Dipodascopsis tothii TaxID=44089 RepID=UPI0034CFCD89
MDVAFIVIQDSNGVVLFVSASIAYVLGFEPPQVEGRPLVELVHAGEAAAYRDALYRTLANDLVATLFYRNVRTRSGRYITCEFLVSVVSDVVISTVTVYRRTVRSEERARHGPAIQQSFMTAGPAFGLGSPDPWSAGGDHELRAALFLNGSSRALPIIYATANSRTLLGMHPQDVCRWSFWDCVDAASLEQAQLVLERTKENHAITYMRFTWRDPRSQREPLTPASRRRGDSHSSSSRSSSTSSLYRGHSPASVRSTHSSHSSRSRRSSPQPAIELEAVASCTSDGLVLVLRAARPAADYTAAPRGPDGAFAAPWGAASPILPLPLPGHTAAASGSRPRGSRASPDRTSPGASSGRSR